MEYVTLTFLIFGVTYSLWRLLFKKNHAPFIPIPKQSIPHLLEHINIADNDVVYDLGCGDARILRSLAKKYPKAKFVGIEKAIFPFLLAKMSTVRMKNVLIKRKNFFKYPISDATIIITYLFPSVMDTLLPKLKNELHNAKLFSFDFPFSEKEHETIYVLKEREKKLGSKIFVYRFE